MKNGCHACRHGLGAVVLLLGLAGFSRAAPSVVPGTPSFGVWAPEFRELHVRIPLQLDPGDGEDVFHPSGVLLNGSRPAYAMWYFDATPFDYTAIPDASRARVEVFVPVFWLPGQTHEITLDYQYGGKPGSVRVEAVAPDGGGAWTRAHPDGNLTFRVREEAGLDRIRELVEFDVIIEHARFPDPAETVRATLFPDDVHTEIPCQVYAVDLMPDSQLVHFRVAVQVSVPAGGQAVVCLWNVQDGRAVPTAGPLTRAEADDAVTIANDDYAIRLSSRSGQLMTWHDRRREVLFNYDDPRKLDESIRVINRTPDVYRVGQPWSHVFDWTPGQYQEHRVQGPVFIETFRQGAMPHTSEELSASVRYRFVAGSPEVRISSVLSADRDTRVLAVRNGGICLTPSLFTHAAWPRGDGRIETLPLDRALGNDTGAPAASRMPVDTPWIALWHRDRGYGFAVHTIRHAYFGKGLRPPSIARQATYVSVYRNLALYTIRSYTQTYHANIRSMQVPLHAGTEVYEEMVWRPFSLEPGEGTAGLEAVATAHRRLVNPLVVVP